MCNRPLHRAFRNDIAAETQCNSAVTLRSTVSPIRLSVVALPRLPPSGSGLVESMALAEPTGLLPSCCQASRLTVLLSGQSLYCFGVITLHLYLVNWFDDPVDAGIAPDGFMLRIDKDYFEILVGRILIDPI